MSETKTHNQLTYYSQVNFIVLAGRVMKVDAASVFTSVVLLNIFDE